jgi:hypothetical protein
MKHFVEKATDERLCCIQEKTKNGMINQYLLREILRIAPSSLQPKNRRIFLKECLQSINQPPLIKFPNKLE